MDVFCDGDSKVFVRWFDCGHLHFACPYFPTIDYGEGSLIHFAIIEY